MIYLKQLQMLKKYGPRFNEILMILFLRLATFGIIMMHSSYGEINKIPGLLKEARDNIQKGKEHMIALNFPPHHSMNFSEFKHIDIDQIKSEHIRYYRKNF